MKQRRLPQINDNPAYVLTFEGKTYIAKDIPGFEGRYAITKCGRVFKHPTPAVIKKLAERPVSKRTWKSKPYRSLRKHPGGQWMKPQPVFTPRGRPKTPYYQVQFQFTEDGVKHYRQERIHRLVAEAFVRCPDPTKQLEVDHKNFDRKDNRAENLQWKTHRKNIRRSFDAGRMTVQMQLHKFRTPESFKAGAEKLRRYRRVALPRKAGKIPVHKRYRHRVEIQWIGELDPTPHKFTLGLPKAA